MGKKVGRLVERYFLSVCQDDLRGSYCTNLKSLEGAKVGSHLFERLQRAGVNFRWVDRGALSEQPCGESDPEKQCNQATSDWDCSSNMLHTNFSFESVNNR